jgi:hypothetical protein
MVARPHVPDELNMLRVAGALLDSHATPVKITMGLKQPRQILAKRLNKTVEQV